MKFILILSQPELVLQKVRDGGNLSMSSSDWECACISDWNCTGVFSLKEILFFLIFDWLLCYQKCGPGKISDNHNFSMSRSNCCLWSSYVQMLSMISLLSLSGFWKSILGNLDIIVWKQSIINFDLYAYEITQFYTLGIHLFTIRNSCVLCCHCINVYHF